MLGFLKVFARGIICTVLLPVILLVWVLYGVYCLITFLVMFVKSVILFFAGDSASGEMKEDIEAKKILLEKEQAQIEQAQVVNMMYQTLSAQQQMLGQQMANQQPQSNAPQQAAPQEGFDPFTPDPVPEEPLPESSNEEQPENIGGESNDQSY
ncbi:MAG: hypothetical protein KBS97_01210 [Firmicutes bacterium]|nr:hypothetical protein [Candidatus Fiminaster equi]